MARYVALLKVATERGHAERTQLRRLLTPEAYTRQFHPEVSSYPGVPPPTAADLGGTHVGVASPRRSLIAVAARQTVERWGALLIDLRVTPGGRMLVADLVRAQDRHLSTQLAPPSPVTEAQVQKQVRGLLRQRRIARDMAARAQGAAHVLGAPAQGSERNVPPPGGWATQLRRLDAAIGRLIEDLGTDAIPRPARVLGKEPAGGPSWDRWRQDYLELRDFVGARLRAPGRAPTGAGLREPQTTPSPLVPPPHAGPAFGL